jgi:hypothetical protein
MLEALQRVLLEMDAGAWEAELSPSDVEQPEPRPWLLRIAGPGYVTIRAVRPEGQNLHGVLDAAFEALALVVPAALT